MRQSSRAFTLVELLVVMIIVAMLSGLVVYSVKGHVDAAAVMRFADRLDTLDRRLRVEARRCEHPISIEFDRARNTISVESVTDLQSTGIRSRIKLPKHVQIDSVRSGQSVGSNRSASLKINQRGQSPNYAIGLVTSAGSRVWLVTLGMSGQHLRCKTEGEVNALLRP